MIVRFHMAKIAPFSLGEHAAPRLFEEQEAKLSALRVALVEGENSGPSIAFDFDRFIARKRKIGSSA
jgi:Arc/MetJ-type ribon-helix-helix transcriptional regulator